MKDVANMIGALAAMAAIFLLYRQLSQRMAERVVRPEGALIAVDADGLRELNELYALPKICGDSNFAKQADPRPYIARCVKAVRLTPEIVSKGTILLAAGTRARSLGTRQVLQDGYVPLQVEKVRVTDGSNEGRVGWVVDGYLNPTFAVGPWP
jgi:hypothetical protein